jgi:hypothetical protein
MVKCIVMVLAGVALAGGAIAGPITIPPPMITALGGNVIAVYVYANAADASYLSLATPPPVNPIFCNAAIGGIRASSNMAGDTINLGNRLGLMTFTLNNTSTGFSYSSTNPDVDGNYHAKITPNFADFGVGALPSGAATALASLPNVTFVGFEDRQTSDQSDWDYNDLIFAFSNTALAHNADPGLPEPLTLSLMGAGLVAAFGLRRFKRSKASRSPSSLNPGEP